MKRIDPSRLAITLLAGMLAGCAGRVSCGNPVADADCVAWSIFAEINQSARRGRDAQWETWINRREVFDVYGVGKPPVWNGTPPAQKSLEALQQLSMLDREQAASSRTGALMTVPPSPEDSEIRMNRPTFDFILKNGLWSIKGLREAYASGKKIDFPPESIEVKAKWEPIPESEKANHHWQYQEFQGTRRLIGLKAIHITSKVLPDWLWATWKHESLLDAIDDRFGYPGNQGMSERLDRIFRDKRLGAQWRHYRLIKTQTRFTDSTGRPSSAGNSAIEVGMGERSSCISCHSMARMDSSGTLLNSCNPCKWDCERNSKLVTGVPDPRWFRGTRQLDFVWSFRILGHLSCGEPGEGVCPIGGGCEGQAGSTEK